MAALIEAQEGVALSERLADIQMEPTRLTVCAIMASQGAAHLNR
jgi:hypothetical protein